MARLPFTSRQAAERILEYGEAVEKLNKAFSADFARLSLDEQSEFNAIPNVEHFEDITDAITSLGIRLCEADDGRHDYHNDYHPLVGGHRERGSVG